MLRQRVLVLRWSSSTELLVQLSQALCLIVWSVPTGWQSQHSKFLSIHFECWDLLVSFQGWYLWLTSLSRICLHSANWACKSCKYHVENIHGDGSWDITIAGTFWVCFRIHITRLLISEGLLGRTKRWETARNPIAQKIGLVQTIVHGRLILHFVRALTPSIPFSSYVFSHISYCCISHEDQRIFKSCASTTPHLSAKKSTLSIDRLLHSAFRFQSLDIRRKRIPKDIIR